MGRKKILLIEPAKDLTDKNLEIYYLNRGYSYTHLGLRSIKATLEGANHKVTIFSTGKKNWYSKLKNTILKENPDYIGISTTSYTIEQDMNIAFLVRVINPKTPIIMGGYHAWGNPQETLENSEADIIIGGMGEYPLMELLKYKLDHPLNDKDAKQIKNIPGISLKFQDKAKRESYLINPPFIANQKQIDTLPLPELDSEVRTQSIFTSLGCSYHCKFCSVPYFYGKPIYLSKEKVMAWIKKVSDANYKVIFLADANFSLNRERVMTLCSEIIKAKKKNVINKSILFRCQARIDLLDDRILDKMKKAGFRLLFLGIETTSPKLLKEGIDKGGKLAKMTPKEIDEKIQMIAQKGLIPYIYLIIGLPDSSKKDIINDLKAAKKWRDQGFSIEISVGIAPFFQTRYYHEYENTKTMVYRSYYAHRLNPDGLIKTKKIKFPYYLRCKDKEAREMISQLNENAEKIVSENKKLKFDHALIEAAEKLGYL